jgi:tRNA threonylcarbamoyladenosine biosynthesis protein TsaB
VIVLGLDTSTAATAVALRVGAGEAVEQRDDPAGDDHPGHATRLLAMAEELLCSRGLAWDELERVAVGLGPGRFTGLRVGVATARGLAHSLSCELAGVSSLRALAAGVLAGETDGCERPEAVLAMIDARRGEVFVAGYLAPAADPERLLARELLGPLALAPERVAERIAQEPARRWLAVGDGALRYAHALRNAGIGVAPDGSRLHRVSAAAVCELGARATPARDREAVLPQYLRRPDAEIALGDAPAVGASRA